MKRLLLFALLSFVFVECKKKDQDPLPALESVVGKWVPVSYTRPDGTTVALKDNEADFMEIRYDGVLLNKDGFTACCSPRSYQVNGVRIDVKPKTAVRSDPSCIYVNCMSCPDMTFTTVSENELVSRYCGDNTTRYVRVK